MATEHISPRVGNVLFIGLVGALGTISVLAIAVWLSKKEIPLASPIAEASLDIVRSASA